MEIFSPKHLLMILLIVLLVFGTKKLRTIGADLGGAVKGFKDAMKPGTSDAQFAERSTDKTRSITNNEQHA